MPLTPEQIAKGTAVVHLANPGRFGFLTGRQMTAFFVMAEVDWGSSVEFIDITRLELRGETENREPDDDVRESRYGTIDDLRRRVTFEKLSGTLTDVFYSMKTSEIDFYAHQFRPVLRFVESATHRLLIADEVGLGKTIEAGLIWTEWQAREKARRLLIVCPPTLVPKWLREMQERFQFAAEATDSKHLLQHLERFDRMGRGVSFVLVASYHALRPRGEEKEILTRIQDGDPINEPGEPRVRMPSRVKLLSRIREQGDEAMLAGTNAPRFLDMVVFDEAHSMKNTASASYLVGELLSGAALAVVCLSATPIHNTSRDLYALLRLIDPEVFRDNYVFDLLVRQNLPVVQLQNALARPNWDAAAIKLLITAISPASERDSLEVLFDSYDGSAKKKVELRHAVERLNLLSNFINRTRKRDVIGGRVLRHPLTLQVDLSPEEVALYKLVLRIVRMEAERRRERVTSFHLLSPALRMSSCLPVVAEELRAGRWGDPEEMEWMEEDFDFEEGKKFDASFSLGDLAAYDFEANDSKYASLRHALEMIDAKSLPRGDNGEDIAVDPKDKIIVFAFFKKTIFYLERRLREDGFPVTSVTGDIMDKDERDRILKKFEGDDTRVLLCSEIGAEGIDLQFARVIVNYDLPWNPMRVEQRIGRIDRIGQRSPSIVIINFYVKDTIDGNILLHLYRKIGVFEQSIGALEGILGEAVSRLTSQLLLEDLTPEMMAQRAEQTGEAIFERARIEADLEENTGALVAFQDLLSEQIGESQRLGKFIRPRELRQHADDFLIANYKAGNACIILPDNPAEGCLQIKLSFAAFSDFDAFCQRAEYTWPDGFSRHDRVVSLTFDPAIHQQIGRRYRSLVLVTHLHPFFRWITDVNSKATNSWHKVSAVRLRSRDFPPGFYFYLIYRMTQTGITRRDAFYYAAKAISSNTILAGTQAELLLSQAIDSGVSLFPGTMDDYSHVLNEVRNALYSELTWVQQAFEKDQRQKFDIRKRQLLAHYDRKIASQQRGIDTARERGRDLRQIKGFEQNLLNLYVKRNDQLAQLQRRADGTNQVLSEIACGVISLTH